MTTPSKQVALSKVEQDALRYRVLKQYLVTVGTSLLLRDNDAQVTHAAYLPAQLDVICEQHVTTEDVAQILIDTTQPSEYVDVDDPHELERICAQATYEIADSIRRGIYQPLVPHDVKVLQACAKLAEQLQKAEPIAQQATKAIRDSTELLHVLKVDLDAFRQHFYLALLASKDHSITIPASLVVYFHENDYVLERRDNEDQSSTFTLKRKQEHQR